jgi:hypothetical protein
MPVRAQSLGSCKKLDSVAFRAETLAGVRDGKIPRRLSGSRVGR